MPADVASMQANCGVLLLTNTSYRHNLCERGSALFAFSNYVSPNLIPLNFIISSKETMATRDAYLTNSSLCEKCQAIFTTETPKEFQKDTYKDSATWLSSAPHHDTLESLASSARQGCYICTYMNRKFSQRRSAARLARKDVHFFRIDFVQIDFNTNWDFRIWFSIYSIIRSQESNGAELRSESSDAKLDRDRIYICGLEEKRAMNMGLSTTLPSGTRSPATLRQARIWFDDCRFNHKCCEDTKAPGPLPSRLIEVGGFSAAGRFARICSGAALSPGTHYLTLSHRWGNSNCQVLTRDSLSDFERSLPVSSLRKVFQDALEVTIALGLTYIWIDSLCIIQDDSLDWERESAKMHDVYRGGFCNLSASGFDSGDEGLLMHERTENPVPPLVSPTWTIPRREKVVVPNKETAEQSVASQKIGDMRTRFIISETDPLDREKYSPLSRRAWVFQEQMLSSRDLHFHKNQLIWGCRRHFANEVWPEGFVTHPEPASGRLYSYWCDNPSQSLFEGYYNLSKISELNDLEAHHAWRASMTGYTDCDITKLSDRLPAINGIVNAFQEPLVGDTYSFGLWMNDPLGLLWSRKLHGNRIGSSRLIDGFPSWSWVSIDQPVRWRYGGHDPKDSAPERMFTKNLNQPDLFAAGSVILRGPLMRVDPTRLHVEEEIGTKISKGNRDTAKSVLLSSEFDTWYLESELDTWQCDDNYPTFPLVYFMPILKVETEDTKTPHGAWGLLLARANSDSLTKFRRVGTATLKSSTEQWSLIFAEYQEILTNEMYQDMCEDGQFTIEIV